jgi:ABC-2 type transport system permease protein
VIAVYRWEIAKLLVQKRTYLGLAAAMGVPLAFVIVLLVKSGSPNDALGGLGHRVRDTGLVVPFIVLFFMSAFAFPLITSLVAGDIVAAESQNGTLKTILTRSRGRTTIFVGKVLACLTYTLAILLLMATVAFVAATLSWGFNPLPSISGPTVSAWHGLGLLGITLAYYVAPLAGVMAIGVLLSTVTRNSAASVVGALLIFLAMGLLTVIPGTEPIRPYLLTPQFDAWHGLIRLPADWAPIRHGLWVCAFYVVAPLVAAGIVFARRDVAGE